MAGEAVAKSRDYINEILMLVIKELRPASVEVGHRDTAAKEATPPSCNTVSSLLSQAWMLCTRTWASWSRGFCHVWISWVTLRCASCSTGCKFMSWSPKRCCRITSTPYWRTLLGRSERILHSYVDEKATMCRSDLFLLQKRVLSQIWGSDAWSSI